MLLKRQQKIALERYATSERVERANVAGQATKRKTADVTKDNLHCRRKTVISADFFISVLVFLITRLQIGK
jgi:hypothetical protein